MIDFFKRITAPLRPDGKSRRIAAAQLRERGARLHLILAAVLCMTLSIGSFYLVELVMLPIPWESLYEDAPSLYRLLDALYYVLDGAIIVLLMLPLVFGTAHIFYAASQGTHLPLSDLFMPFQSARCYRRSTLVMLLLLVPRLAALWLARTLWQGADGLALGWRLTLYALAIALLVALSLLFTLDDAVLPLAFNDASLGPRALWRISARRNVGHMTALFRFKLGYLGHLVLSVLSLGTLLILHTLPLYALAHKAYTDDLLSVAPDQETSIADFGKTI